MKKNIVIIIIFVIIGLLTLGQTSKKETKDISAYVVKVIRDVNMRTPTTGWQKAVPLSKLKSGYEVQTDKGSLAMILFADQSKLILREKSIVTIKGEVRGNEILSRSVHMDRGTMIFNVKKAETEQFRFSSPISVASIRGTEGGYNTGGNADFLTISEGLAEFTNSVSGHSSSVASGQTGVADSTGNLNVRKANKGELDNIHNAQHVGEGERNESHSNSQGGITVNGTITFDPPPTAGNSASVKLDLTPTNADIAGVKVYFRKRGDAQFQVQTMTVSQKVASAQIPAASIQSPALEYYFAITIGNQTINLPSAGANSPGSITVTSAVSSQNVSGLPMFNPLPARSYINLRAGLDLSATTANIDKVTLFYRRGGDAAFKQLELALSGKNASGTIPGIDVRTPELSYYYVIKLRDSTGTEVTLPDNGSSTPLTISIPPLTRIVPDFGQLKSKRAGTVRVDLSSLQATVSMVDLFHRKKDEPTFTDLPLTISGQIASAQIVGDKVKFPQVEYYLSIKFDDGSIVLVPQDGSTNPLPVAVEPIQRELRIAGQTGSLQKKVIVLRWSE